MKTLLTLAAFTLTLVPAARAEVLVVAPSGFTTVQAAVDAAASGDVILVRGGAGGTFTVAGKSLTLVGDGGTDAACVMPQLFGNVMGQGSQHNVVSGIGAGGVVVLRGLLLSGLEVTDVQGTVWVEDCVIQTVSPAMRATSCQRLVVTHSTLTGPFGFIDAGAYFWGAVGGALELIDTHAAVSDSVLSGGDGKGFGVTQVGPSSNESGGDGLRVSGGSLSLQGCTLSGGDGGLGGSWMVGFCTNGGDGGAGLRVLGGAQVSLLDSSATGGAGGPGPGSSGCEFAGGQDGADGEPVAAPSGSVLELSGVAAGLQVAGPVREGEDVELAVEGTPGAFVTLLLSFAPGLQPVGKVVGPIQVALPTLMLSIGVLPAGGELVVHANLPNLPASLLSIQAFLQAVIAGPAPGSLQSSAPSVLVGLEASL